MKTISIPVNNRPHYLRRALDSIRAAEGHQDWVLVISAEPGCTEILEMIHSIDWIETRVSVNRIRRKIDANTFNAADLAWAVGSEFNLYTEEDVVISKDTLLMADWFRQTIGDENAIMPLRRLRENHATPHVLRHSHDGLFGDGFAYNVKTCWEKALRGWWFYYKPCMQGYGWDWSLAWMLEELGWKQYRPMANRSQNIGLVGTNSNPGWADPNHVSPCYDGLIREFEIDHG